MKAIHPKIFWLLVLCVPMWVQAQTAEKYTVKPGDTLFSIARAHNVSVDDLREWNDLGTGSIRAGMVLIVSDEPEEEPAIEAPAIPDEEAAEGEPDPSPPEEQGETIQSVADRLGMTVEQLLVINPDIQTSIDRLNLAPAQPEPTTNTYVVKAGDTLFGIARSFGMTLDQLSDLNGLTQTSVRIGQKLKVPGSGYSGSAVWSSRGIIDAMMYPPTFVDRRLVSGVRYSETMYIVGHATLPIGTLIMLGREGEGPSVLCVVADESLSVSVEVIDVSFAVANAIGLEENERVEVFTLK